MSNSLPPFSILNSKFEIRNSLFIIHYSLFFPLSLPSLFRRQAGITGRAAGRYQATLFFNRGVLIFFSSP
jgi:hypothetical protein